MGCDIHMYSEKKVYRYEDKEKTSGIWVSADKWTQDKDQVREEPEDKDPWPEYKLEFRVSWKDSIYSERNYNVFAALCGVRSGANWECISDPKGLPDDVSTLVKTLAVAYGDDGHSHNWNTMRELKEFDWTSYGDTCKHFLDRVLTRMEEIRKEQ